MCLSPLKKKIGSQDASKKNPPPNAPKKIKNSSQRPATLRPLSSGRRNFPDPPQNLYYYNSTSLSHPIEEAQLSLSISTYSTFQANPPPVSPFNTAATFTHPPRTPSTPPLIIPKSGELHPPITVLASRYLPHSTHYASGLEACRGRASTSTHKLM